ncbi:hypothetical protein BDC45DRAFT_537518 [Circinella umbellata]|nr:hypothetical protein BDC45DRAFT_537518 [Circinella umbellata]
MKKKEKQGVPMENVNNPNMSSLRKELNRICQGTRDMSKNNRFKRTVWVMKVILSFEPSSILLWIALRSIKDNAKYSTYLKKKVIVQARMFFNGSKIKVRLRAQRTITILTCLLYVAPVVTLFNNLYYFIRS